MMALLLGIARALLRRPPTCERSSVRVSNVCLELEERLRTTRPQVELRVELVLPLTDPTPLLPDPRLTPRIAMYWCFSKSKTSEKLRAT